MDDADPTSEEETTDLNEKILDPQAMDVDKQPLEDDIPDVTQKPKVTNIGSAHQTDEDKDEDEDEDDNGDKAKDAPQNDDGQVRASRPDETETGDNKMQEIADNLPPVSPGQASAHPVDDLALADMDLDDPNRPGTPSFSGLSDPSTRLPNTPPPTNPSSSGQALHKRDQPDSERSPPDIRPPPKLRGTRSKSAALLPPPDTEVQKVNRVPASRRK